MQRQLEELHKKELHLGLSIAGAAEELEKAEEEHGKHVVKGPPGRAEAAQAVKLLFGGHAELITAFKQLLDRLPEQPTTQQAAPTQPAGEPAREGDSDVSMAAKEARGLAGAAYAVERLAGGQEGCCCQRLGGGKAEGAPG